MHKRNLLKTLFVLASLLCYASGARADSTVTALTAASALTGTELLYCIQAAADRKCTISQVPAIVGTMPVTGGAAGNLLYTDGTLLQASGGVTWAGTGQLLIALGTITTNLKAVNITGTWNAVGTTFDAPLFMNITNTASAAASLLMDLQVGSASKASIKATGQINTTSQSNTFTNLAAAPDIVLNGAQGGQSGLFGNTGNNSFGFGSGGNPVLVYNATLNPVVFTITTSTGLGWSTDGFMTAVDTTLFRDAANIIGQRNGTNAQTKRVYNTFTDASNYERGVMDWTTTANTLIIGTQNAGTGAARAMNLVTSGTNAITISTAQLVALPAITTDATHTDATVCEDTTTHALYFGSGAAGICLGTSSIRFKQDIAPLNAGLDDLLKVEAVRYRYRPGYGDPSRQLYGFTAEQMAEALPELVGYDGEGKPNSVDWAGMVPVLVRAIQQQQTQIDELKRRIK